MESSFAFNSKSSFHWIIREFKFPNDLPDEVVRDVIMSNDSLVWIATWGGGVVVFNGSKNKVLNTFDGLISDDVRVLEEDHDGRIWVGTADGISCIDNNEIFNFTSNTNSNIPINTSITSIKSMHNGEVWFGDGKGNLFAWIPPVNSKNVLSGTWKHIYKFVGGSDLSIREIHQNNNRDIWLAVFGIGNVHFRNHSEFEVIHENIMCKGLIVLSDKHFMYIGYRDVVEHFVSSQTKQINSPYDLTCLTKAFGTYFIGTENGLFTINNDQLIPFELTRDDRIYYITSLSFLPDGSLWVGTRSGAFRITESNWIRQFTSPSTSNLFSASLVQNKMNHLFVMDQDYVIWKYENKKWSEYYRINIKPEHDRSPYMITIDDTLFVHIDRSLIVKIENNGSKHQIIPLQHDKDISGNNPIFIPFNHQIWTAGIHGLFNTTSDNEFALQLSANNGKNIHTVFQTSNGEFWISGSGWIEHCEYENCQTVTIPEPLYVDSFEMTSVIQDQDGALWYAMLGEGILKYKNSQWTKISLESGLPNDYINVLYQSKDGTIWAGGRNRGILSYNNNRWIQYTYSNGFPMGRVHNIVEDEEGNIWAGVEGKGIFKLVPDEIPPAVEIASAPDQLVPDAQGVFSFQGNDAWNHTTVDQLVYSHRVIRSDNFETVQDWSPFSAKTSVLVDSLIPGNYIFEVLSQDEFRNISDDPAQAHFAVIPYFWTRYQFQLPVLIALLVVIVWLWNWSKQFQQLLVNQNKLKADIVATSKDQQQKLARELHDSIVREFVGISIVSKGLLDQLQSQQSQHISQVQMVLKGIGNITQHIRKIEKGLLIPDEDQIGLFPTLQNIAVHIQNLFGISCRIINNNHLCFNDKHTETVVCQIAHEALFNAAKHAQANNIELILDEEASYYTVLIQDDGIGFSTDEVKGGSGIKHMKHRADLIQAKLEFQLRDTGGTMVICQIPKTRNNHE